MRMPPIMPATVFVLVAAFSGAETAPKTVTAPPAANRSVKTLLRLAQRQSEQKNAAGALASLRAARAIAPNSEDVLSAYAQALSASATPDAAVPVLEALTRLYPTVGLYHYWQGEALLAAGDASGAAVSLQEAARLEPDQPAMLAALGAALVRGQLYADAKPQLLRAVSLRPDDLQAVAALADAEAGLGELKEAEEHARRVLARAEGDPTAHRVLAAVFLAQDRPADARDALQKAAAADPTSARADYDHLLSLVYTRLGDAASAATHQARSLAKEKQRQERMEKVRRAAGLPKSGSQP